MSETSILTSLQAIEQGNSEQPTIVLLHGIGINRRMWEPQIAALSQSFHIIAPDYIPRRYPELAENAKIEMKQMGKRGLLATTRAVGRVNFRNNLSQITVPTLVLCGSKDRWNQAAAREMAEKIPRAELKIIEGAGHVWNLEMPKLFTQTVSAFIQRVENKG